jgi:hypothetical protein
MVSVLPLAAADKLVLEKVSFSMEQSQKTSNVMSANCENYVSDENYATGAE